MNFRKDWSGRNNERNDYMNALFKARTQRLVTFGICCNKVASYKRQIPQSVIRELSDYNLSLVAMKEDPVLKDIAIKNLEVLDLLRKYASDHNRGDEVAAKEYLKQSVKAHNEGDRLIMEVVNRGYGPGSEA
jgi:hypothetical protein